MSWKTICIYIDMDTGEILPIQRLGELKREYEWNTKKNIKVDIDRINLTKTIYYGCRKTKQTEIKWI